MSSQQPPFPPQPPPYPPQYPYQPPPAQKSNALKWILIGLGTVFFLAVAIIGAGGYIAYRAAKSAGLDTGLLARNPGFAAARLAASLDPETEVLSSDADSGTIVIRNKKDGKTVTLRFDAEKKSMVVVDDDGKETSVSITGGGLDFKGPDGKSVVTFGAGSGNTLPDWVPAYPGATLEGQMTSKTDDGESHTVTFKTGDSSAKVIDFYQARMKGFTASTVAKTPAGGLLVMTDAGEAHMLTVTAGTSDGQTQGSITAVEKK